MKLDFSSYQINRDAYSARPMSFLDAEPSTVLTVIAQIALIETGDRAARERWQKTQLRNLLGFAIQRSTFWRQRIGSKGSDTKLSALPVLTRNDIKQQVAQEGALLRQSDGISTTAHTTSGSSATPVKFHASQMNAQYNEIRSLAQSFIEGKDLSTNMTRLASARLDAAKEIVALPSRLRVTTFKSSLSALGPVFASGPMKYIECVNPVPRDLVRELRKDPVGLLVSNPQYVNAIVSHFGAEILKELRVTEFIAFAEAIDPDLYAKIATQGIPVLSNYSAEEVGAIGFECPAAPGHYHVATSNVIVEISDAKYELSGQKLGRVLVTHLHSYATPFIRYDLGDFALLSERCPCGHDGPAIHHLHGRVANSIKNRDGTYSAFYARGSELAKLAQFSEFRIRQVGFEKIVVELGGRSELSPAELSDVTDFIRQRVGEAFEIEVLPCATIDWGESVKRQSFRCEI
jgi:phenylacetate-CoA ligase